MHRPPLLPPFHPSLLLTLTQKLTDLEKKLIAMEIPTSKDDGVFGSNPGASQQDTELLAQETMRQQAARNVSPEESSLNVTNKVPKKKKNWWPSWSRDEEQMDPNTKSSVKEDPAISPVIHYPPPANYENINKMEEMELQLADITTKITTFEQNFSNLELIDQKIKERVTRLETGMRVAEENPKIATFEQNFSNLELIDQKISEWVVKLETFLENAGAWNKKLDELFKDSQSHAQLAPDMTDSDQEHC